MAGSLEVAERLQNGEHQNPEQIALNIRQALVRAEILTAP